MKKIILTVLVCLLFTAFASAQTDVPATITAGIKGGTDFSSFPANSGFTNHSQMSYLGGFWGNFSLGFINFQPEVYIIEKKVDVTFTQPGSFYNENSRFTTADIPLLFGGKFGGSKFAVRLYTGPVLSLALSRVQSFSNDNFYTQRLAYPDENIAWQFGAGFNVKKFTLDVRYEAGIDKVPYGAQVNPVTGVQTSSTHLNIISLSIGYTLFSSYGDYTYQ
jgi:hypothetical protein